MIRFIARFVAKRQYIFKLEKEGQVNELNARVALKNATDRRSLIDQLNREADDIDANIAKEEETEEYKALTGQEKYEADREKDEAKKIAAEKRRAAEAEAINVSEGEKTAQMLRNMAQSSFLLADKIRKL